jgi:hypothetical protein
MNWFTRFTIWLNRFMAGRHGGDQFSAALLILYCTLLILSSIFRSGLLLFLATAALIWCIWRMFSRNSERRWKENDWFLSWWTPFWHWLRSLSSRFHSAQDYAAIKARDRAVCRYFKCPKCKSRLRVPKGKGRISITCPVCHTQFIKRT